MTLAALNMADRDRFVDAVGWVFEHSPWVAERVWERRPFTSVDALHDAMTRVVAEATRDEQLALVRAHPDLGARLRSGAAAGGLTGASRDEQAGAGLDALTDDERERLDRLNAEYRQRFGFPFLLAVKGCTRQQIAEALEARLPRGADEEFLEALRQVSRIARFRLERMFETGFDFSGFVNAKGH